MEGGATSTRVVGLVLVLVPWQSTLPSTTIPLPRLVASRAPSKTILSFLFSPSPTLLSSLSSSSQEREREREREREISLARRLPCHGDNNRDATCIEKWNKVGRAT